MVLTQLHVPALATYDHLLTLHREVRCIWQQKCSKGTLLFVANRYALLSFAVILVTLDLTSNVRRFYEVFTLILSFCTSVFTAWRVSIIWNRSTPVFIAVFSLVSTSLVMYLVMISCFAFDIWLIKQPATQMIFFTSRSAVYNGLYQQVWCLAISRLSQTSQHKYLTTLRAAIMATRICVLAGDTLAVALTWVKTYRYVKDLHQVKAANVTERLIRDGYTLLGFGLAVLLIKNTILVTSILHTFTGILVSRFFLELREVAIVEVEKQGGSLSPSAPSQVSLGQANEQILRDK
ncbi:hypothetical protein BC629DRAFT_1550749 [Irpex lacteus]|nr:hypothetical protein BC629DRAFT_1550749 [Irpex lacteus]